MSLHALAISGSLRTESWNRKALRIASEIASNAGVSVVEADLKKLALPMYDGDLEADGLPASVQRFKLMVEEANLFLIASPEYNGSISGGLKNAIDWATRGNNSFAGKVAAIFGASEGINGTIRMQLHLRQILSQLNVIVIPSPVVLIRSAQNAFTTDGTFVDPALHTQLMTLIERAMNVANALQSPIITQHSQLP
jgi:chromate reductase